MCLIVTKPKGVPMPSKKNMSQWFTAHPDGFGLAYIIQDKVRILKGAMTINQMYHLVNVMNKSLKGGSQSVNVILHYRQATGGKVAPENCHPFPLTKDPGQLASLDVLADCAVAHNGIIFGYEAFTKALVDDQEVWTFPYREKTDTQQFIEDRLVDLGSSLFFEPVQRLIKDCTNSKFALLRPVGIDYIGDFIEEKGYKYSNGGYKEVSFAVTRIPPAAHLMYEDGLYEEGDYGYLCNFCEQYTYDSFVLPNDTSIVCPVCYELFTGCKPTEEDRFIKKGVS